MLKAALVLFGAGGILGFLGIIGSSFAHGGPVNGIDCVLTDLDEELYHFSNHFDHIFVTRNGIIWAENKTDSIQVFDKEYSFRAETVENLKILFMQGDLNVFEVPNTDKITVRIEGDIRFECECDNGTLSLRPCGNYINIGFPDNYTRVTVLVPMNYRPKSEYFRLAAANLWITSTEADRITIDSLASLVEVTGGVSSDHVTVNADVSFVYFHHINSESVYAYVNVGEFIAGMSEKMNAAELMVNVGKMYFLTSSPDYYLNSSNKFFGSSRYLCHDNNTQKSGEAGEINVNCNLGTFVLECE